MKKTFLILAALMVSVLASAKTYDLAGFTKINAVGIYDVTVVKSPDWKVVVECSDDLQDYVVAKISVNTLVLSFKTLSLKRLAAKDAYAHATIYMPNVSELELSGSCTFTSEDCFEMDERFSLEVKGASKVKHLEFKASSADISVSGASKAEFLGEAKSVSVDCSGASKVACRVDADRVDLDLNGASNVGVEGVIGKLEMDVNAACEVSLKDCKVHEMEIDLSGAAKLYAEEAVVDILNADLGAASFATVYVTELLSVDLGAASKLIYSGPDTLRMGSIDVSSGATFRRM